MTTTDEAFVGIDVAFAKAKRFPICVLARQADRVPAILPLRSMFEKPPAGKGNAAALSESVPRAFAREVLEWLQRLERDEHLIIRRVAIDAPSDYCRNVSGRRAAERCLDSHGISCFTTPSEDEFATKIQQSQMFLNEGGALSRLPNANQIWMLVGFELFRTLSGTYECIETYPQAIVQQLSCADQHKASAVGLQCQIEKAADLVGLSPARFRTELDRMGYGSLHDRVDAFLAAWIASLEEPDRVAFGTPPHDAIWVPGVGPKRSSAA